MNSLDYSNEQKDASKTVIHSYIITVYAFIVLDFFLNFYRPSCLFHTCMGITLSLLLAIRRLMRF